MMPLDEVMLFIKIVELKSFTAAAENLLLSRSLASKKINRLEERLGVQLLNRTTRRLALTEAGRIYYQYCLQVENTLQEAESAVSDIRAHPKGNLNINAPVTFGQLVLPEIIAKFLVKYPDVKINLALSDTFIDIIEGGYDLVIRIGELEDSSLKARKVGNIKLRVFAHKKYLKKYGTPQTPKDLKGHNCLGYKHMTSGVNEWHFEGPKGSVHVPISGNFTADNGVPLYHAVNAGLGIAIQPSFMLDTFYNKNITYLLQDFIPNEIGVFAVYPPAKRPPLNTRVFIDFLVEALEK